MPQTNMPENWEPPYPSWSSVLHEEVEEVVIGYLAAQTRLGDLTLFTSWVAKYLSSEYGPSHYEVARFVDASGYQNQVYVCYWTDRNIYKRWVEAESFHTWWNDEIHLSGGYGLWREVMYVPVQRLETLFSSQHKAGLASTGKKFTGPIQEHAYWGGMRDRIPESDSNPFIHSNSERIISKKEKVTSGKKITITPEENFCLIRSAQNWTECKGEELDIYTNEVHPTLIKGMDYLRDNPIDSGCLSCRFMTEIDGKGGDKTMTFGMALFISMSHLEAWAKSHPSHLAIFQSFHKMVKQMNFEIDLRLWHEVVVLPKEQHVFEYINCHPNTGLLPYYDAD